MYDPILQDFPLSVSEWFNAVCPYGLRLNYAVESGLARLTDWRDGIISYDLTEAGRAAKFAQMGIREISTEPNQQA